MRKLFLFVLTLMMSLSANSEPVTLWCVGSMEGSNAYGQRVNADVSTSVKFDADDNYFLINDTKNLEQYSEFPYKKVIIGPSNILWDTPIIDFLGKGSFSGSIDRKTGELKTNYFAILNTGAIVTINSKMMCERRQSNRF